MIDTLRQYEADGLLYSQTHPTLPLIIWNYSQKVQYEGLWDDVTIMARGLVTDDDGNVISKGFSKFFNIEEGKHTPTNEFEVFEKLDGQYIGVFWYDGQMVVNSRGSFTSPYAIEARRILDEKYPSFVKNPSSFTFCFELIGFYQIVVSYPEPDLVLTGIFSKSVDFDNLDVIKLYCSETLPVVTKYSGIDYTKIKQLNWPNAEGFVVRFSNGDRCKIKFEDYVRLHRQMTNLSERRVLWALVYGIPVSDTLTDVPDEFFDEIREIEAKFKGQYLYIIDLTTRYFKLFEPLLANDLTLAVQRLKDNPLRHFILRLANKQDPHGDIWRFIWNNFKEV